MRAKSINHSQLTVAATGIATGPTNYEIYTATDGDRSGRQQMERCIMLCHRRQSNV